MNNYASLPVGSILSHETRADGHVWYQIKRSNIYDRIQLRPVWKRAQDIPGIKLYEYQIRIGRDPEVEQRRSTNTELAEVESTRKRAKRQHDTWAMDMSLPLSQVFARVFATPPTLTTVPTDIFVDQIATMLHDKDVVQLSRVNRQAVDSFRNRSFPLRNRHVVFDNQDTPYSNQHIRLSGSSFHVTHIRMANYFDDPLDWHINPDAPTRYAKTLSMGTSFNQDVPVGALPHGLEVLDLGYRFNRVLAPGSIPATLVELELSVDYNQPIRPGVLPSSLRILRFGSSFNSPIAPGVLPEGLEWVVFGESNDVFNHPFEPGVFPDSIQTIELSYAFNQPIPLGVFPPRLGSISFGSQFNQELIPGVFQSLRNLIIGRDFNRRIRHGVLPSGLVMLYFGRSFNQRIEPGDLPSSLLQVTFGAHFNQLLSPGVFPSGISVINLGSGFNQPLAIGLFPDTVDKVELQGDFNQRIVPGVFAPTIQTIIFSYDMSRAYHRDPTMIDLGVLSDERKQEDVLELVDYDSSSDEEEASDDDTSDSDDDGDDAENETVQRALELEDNRIARSLVVNQPHMEMRDTGDNQRVLFVNGVPIHPLTPEQQQRQDDMEIQARRR